MVRTHTDASSTPGRTAVRILLALFMLVAGIGHFSAHEEFLKQTPTWLPARSWLVWVTGVLEIGLGAALLAWPRQRRRVGLALALFLLAVLPGNVHQAIAGTDAFGLESDVARWVRLLFQPVLIALVLWSTDGWPPTWRRRGATAISDGRADLHGRG